MPKQDEFCFSTTIVNLPFALQLLVLKEEKKKKNEIDKHSMAELENKLSGDKNTRVVFGFENY